MRRGERAKERREMMSTKRGKKTGAATFKCID